MRPKREVVGGKQECITCHQWLPLECFYVYRASSTGRDWRCKECHKRTKFGGMTPSERARKWALEHPERAAELTRMSQLRIKFNADRLERRRESVRRYYEEHSDRVLAAHRAYLEGTPWARVADRARSLVRASLKTFGLKGGKKLRELVGCDGKRLWEHFKRNLLPGMGVYNFGRGGWTVGHVRPCAEFGERLLTPEGLRECFHYTNLRPEWERSNLVKFTYAALTSAQEELEKRRGEGQEG